MRTPALPDSIRSEAQLDDLLSEPNAAAIAALEDHAGDVLLLGAGGKMGLSLAKMVRRAADLASATRRVIGVSRFSDANRERQLQDCGVETIRCDLMDADSIAQLPDADIVFAMTGHKFGTGSNPSVTWATNVVVPSLVCRRYSSSRIVAFSTGNVYPLVAAPSSGSVETDPCGPVGEYAMSALGRERVYAYYGVLQSTRLALLRLNYAVEMRYGVLVDIAQRVWADRPVDVSMGWVNVIWQGDACCQAIAALAHVEVPPFVVNLAGTECMRVRDVAMEFAQLLRKQVQFVGEEQPQALLSDGSKSYSLFGRPRVSADQMISWIADWIQRGGAQLGKPTHFEVTDGGF